MFLEQWFQTSSFISVRDMKKKWSCLWRTLSLCMETRLQAYSNESPPSSTSPVKPFLKCHTLTPGTGWWVLIANSNNKAGSWFHITQRNQIGLLIHSKFIQRFKMNQSLNLLFVARHLLSAKKGAVSGRAPPMHKSCWQDTSSSPSCPQQAASGLTSCTWSEKYCRCVKSC